MAWIEYYIGDRGPYYMDDADPAYGDPGQMALKGDVGNLAADLAEHEALAIAHGRASALVGVSDAQYLTNKKFGAGSDYSTFDADGSLHFEGAATNWADLLGPTSGIKVQGTGVALNDAEQTIDFTNTANLSDYGWISFQMQHSWKAGSTLNPHIHWERAGANVPNFLMRYRWQVLGAAKVTAWTDYVCNTAVGTYVSGTQNSICHGAGLTPPVGYGLSDILQIRFFRDNANTSGLFAGADAAGALVAVASVDVHIEIDMLGSKTEFTK